MTTADMILRAAVTLWLIWALLMIASHTEINPKQDFSIQGPSITMGAFGFVCYIAIGKKKDPSGTFVPYAEEKQ